MSDVVMVDVLENGEWTVRRLGPDVYLCPECSGAEGVPVYHLDETLSR